jgi:uncharacterized protein (DUF1778 family)
MPRPKEIEQMPRPKELENDTRFDLAVSASSENVIVALDDDAWKQFVEALEGPARVIPEVVELFRTKAPWD